MTFSFAEWQAGQTPPKGWDAADAVDAGWSKDQLDNFMRGTAKPWMPQTERKEVVPPEQHRRQHQQAETRPGSAPDAAGPVAQAKTMRQAKADPATVTELHTRRTVRADDSWQLQLVCNDEGKAKPGVTKNWALFLENHPETAGVFAFDAFKQSIVLMRKPPWDWQLNHFEPRTLQDRDLSEAIMWLEARHLTPKVSNILSLVKTIAERQSFDRLREYLDGLEWDGVPRVEGWLSECLGVEDTPYARTVGLRWLISSVARGLKPGCKVDTMPILEGPQGARKSTFLRVLYGDEFFTDELSDIGGKDAIMELQGVWGLEVAEMHRFSQSETNAVKKFLSRQTDRYRPPYGRSVIEAPRRVVICGTINPEGNAYLRDPTGARRFWPVVCGKIDLDRLHALRDQLWAEAVVLFHADTPWWVQENEREAVEAQQEQRTDVDVWLSIISAIVKGKAWVTEWEVLEALGIHKRDADRRHSDRVGRIMKKLGFERVRDRSDGDDQTIFRNPRAPTQEKMDW